MSSIGKLRRIQNEIKDIQKYKVDYEKMFEIKMIDDNIYNWDVTLYGPENSLYEGYEFKLTIVLPDEYPIKPLAIKFITPILHVNVNKYGEICLDILNVNWSSVLNMSKVLVSIIALLGNPNPSDAFNSDLANLLRRDEKAYIESIKNSCKKNCKTHNVK